MQRNEIQSDSNFLPKRNHLRGVFFNLTLLVTVFMSTLVQAQTPSAIVEFESTEKGILIPRMSGNEIGAIVGAVEGLMVYNTDTHQFFYHNGTDWQAFPSGAKGPRGQEGISIDTVFVIEGMPSPLKSIVIEYSDQSMDTLVNVLIPGPAGEKGNDGVGIAQTISLMGDSLALSDGGGKVKIDTSNTNEKITALAVVGDSLSITEGGMTMKVAVDSSNVNELQILTLVADSIVLSGGGGKVGVDTSNTNEKITGFGIVGDSLYIKEGSMDTMKVALPVSGGGGGFTHYIGEQFGGGVIFHLWKEGETEHGLVVATTDQSTSQAWSNVTSTAIGATSRSTWDGMTNSNSIVVQSGHTGSAAKLCLDLVSGGQIDWYLPAIDELSLLWHNRFNVNKTLSTIGGATQLPVTADYWSSTEYNSSVAWLFNCYNGWAAYDYSKNVTTYVRAVRAF